VSYRIRQEDLDGKYEYSSVVYVSVPRVAGNVFVAGRVLNVVLPGGFEGCSIVVYDSQGRVLRKVAGVVGTMAIGGLMGRSIYYVTVRSPEGDVRMRRGVYME